MKLIIPRISHILFFAITIITMVSLYCIKSNDTIDYIYPNEDNIFNDWNIYDPIEYLEILKNNPHSLLIVKSAPKSWIKKKHIGALMKLIHSNEKIPPVVSQFSSYNPMKRKSTIGTEVMFLIEGYRKGVYPPTLCSVWDFKGDKNEYLEGWKNNK